MVFHIDQRSWYYCQKEQGHLIDFWIDDTAGGPYQGEGSVQLPPLMWCKAKRHFRSTSWSKYALSIAKIMSSLASHNFSFFGSPFQSLPTGHFSEEVMVESVGVLRLR